MVKWFIPCFLMLPLVAGAQDETEKKAPVSGQDKASFEKKTAEEFPFEGEVKCDRLNVRMLASTESNSIIATILTGGTHVTVVGETNGFYQILPPKGCAVWVFARNIKREGDTGTVLNGNTPVRIDSRVNARKLGTLKEGETVSILREHMGWFKIAAPKSVPYFVGTRFVRRIGESTEETAPEKKAEPVASEDAEALAKIREAEILLDEQSVLLKDRRILELDYTDVIHAYEAAALLAKTALIKSQAETSAKTYRDFQKLLDRSKAQILSKKEELKILKQLREAEKVKREAKKKKTFAFTGYIRTVGLISNRPGNFKLMMGDKMVCWLKAKDGTGFAAIERKLKWHYKEYVGVNGKTVKDPNGFKGTTLLIVEELVPLTQPKK